MGFPTGIKCTTITASASIKGSAGELYGAIITPGAADSVLTVYDNTAASGTVVLGPTLHDGNNTISIVFPNPISCATGIYAKIAGTAPSIQILWR